MNAPQFGAPCLPARFWSKIKIDRGSGCWLWQAARSHNGYGRFHEKKRTGAFRIQPAHRVAFESLVAPVPAALQCDHRCRVRNCVNPAHLEPVTNAVNCRRAALARTHCKRGHAFDAANTRTDKRGVRRCHACLLATKRRYNKRRSTERLAQQLHQAAAELATFATAGIEVSR